jgi:hypothetical protein
MAALKDVKKACKMGDAALWEKVRRLFRGLVTAFPSNLCASYRSKPVVTQAFHISQHL